MTEHSLDIPAVWRNGRQFTAEQQEVLQQAASILRGDATQLPLPLRTFESSSSDAATTTIHTPQTSNSDSTRPYSDFGASSDNNDQLPHAILTELVEESIASYPVLPAHQGSAEVLNTSAQPGLLTSLIHEANSHLEQISPPLNNINDFMQDANASYEPDLSTSLNESPIFQHGTGFQESFPYSTTWDPLGFNTESGNDFTYGANLGNFPDDHAHAHNGSCFDETWNRLSMGAPNNLPETCSFHVPDYSMISTGSSLKLSFDYDVGPGEGGRHISQPFSSISAPMSPVHAEAQTNPLNNGRILGGPFRTSNKKKPQRIKELGPLDQSHRPHRRKAFSDPEKKETGQTRKDGACLRCRMQRIRCYPDPNNARGPCLTCQGIVGPTQSKLPCLRYKIAETCLFDKGSHPQFIWSRRWKEMKIVEIETWESSDIKTIELTQDVGGATYQVQVRRFVPIEGDSLERKWKTNGEARSHPCAPYAIANMKEVGELFLKFVDQNIGMSVEYYVEKSDELLRSTYAMAFRHSKTAERESERLLLKNTLRLWVAVRMESRSERICGAETLGMSPQDYDAAAKNYGQFLVPPVLSAQIELIMTSVVLQPMKREVLSQLQELVKANRTKSWFAIYLCMFILLHSCALLTSFQHMQAKKYGLSSRYIYNAFIEELHNGGKIMLAYFHYCNKGSHPFAMDWNAEKNIKLAELNLEQVTFLKRTAELVNERSSTFKDVKEGGQFEHEYFFLAQLYDLDWLPMRTI